MRLRIIWATVAFGVVLLATGLMNFSLTALPEPSSFEIGTADLAKRSVIRWASRRGVPRRPGETPAGIEMGATHYGLDCSICHGADGRAQALPGRWMYPRAADLTSSRVQIYSDQELFWIINNGIRFTGMPGFGRVETSDRIWGLVDYVREFRSSK